LIQEDLLIEPPVRNIPSFLHGRQGWEREWVREGEREREERKRERKGTRTLQQVRVRTGNNSGATVVHCTTLHNVVHSA
jgi:hypothetical protein